MNLPRAACCTAWPPADRAGEVDIGDFRGGDHLRRVVMGQHEMLEQALRQAGGIEGLLEILGAKRRLGGMLQDHGIAGHQRRHHAVDRGEIGIVPGRHDEHDAQRLAVQHAGEAGLVGEASTSASASGARLIMKRARSSKPRISNGLCAIGRPICRVISSACLSLPSGIHRPPCSEILVALGDRHPAPLAPAPWQRSSAAAAISAGLS